MLTLNINSSPTKGSGSGGENATILSGFIFSIIPDVSDTCCTDMFSIYKSQAESLSIAKVVSVAIIYCV